MMPTKEKVKEWLDKLLQEASSDFEWFRKFLWQKIKDSSIIIDIGLFGLLFLVHKPVKILRKHVEKETQSV